LLVLLWLDCSAVALLALLLVVRLVRQGPLALLVVLLQAVYSERVR